MMRRILRLIDHVAHVGVWVSGAMLLSSSMIIGVDVFARKLFSFTVPGSQEIASYALAISSAWAFSFTLLKRGHIRIDAIYNLLSERWRVALDFGALLSLGTFIGFVTWYGLGVLTTSIRLDAHANTPLGTPMWIPQSLWFAGLCLFMVVVVVLAVAAFRALASADYPGARRLVGIYGTDEEVEEEMEEASRLRGVPDGGSDV